MNKFIKLPLFLGVVGGLCGGVLALTHFATKDIIADAEYQRANAAFYEHFEDFDKKNSVEVSETLASAGVTAKYYIFNADLTYIGSVYQCEAVGYAGKSKPIKFTISFDETGKENNYVLLSHSETNQGSKFMTWLDGDNNGDRLSNLDAGKAESGSTDTYKAVKKSVDACKSDASTIVDLPTYIEEEAK